MVGVTTESPANISIVESTEELEGHYSCVPREVADFIIIINA